MVKRKAPEGLFLLAGVGVRALAVVDLANLVRPHSAQGVVEFALREAIGPLVALEQFLSGLFLVRQSAHQHVVRDGVGILISLPFGVHTLILGVDLVAQGVHIGDLATVDHSDDHLKNVLLHSVVFLSGLLGFPSL